MRNPLPRIRMFDGFNEGWITKYSGLGSASFASKTHCLS